MKIKNEEAGAGRGGKPETSGPRDAGISGAQVPEFCGGDVGNSAFAIGTGTLRYSPEILTNLDWFGLILTISFFYFFGSVFAGTFRRRIASVFAGASTRQDGETNRGDKRGEWGRSKGLLKVLKASKGKISNLFLFFVPRMEFPILMQIVSQVIDFRLRELHAKSAFQGILDSRRFAKFASLPAWGFALT